ncbi:hypothetical protein BS78_01G302200 [Paspalum vaginatum]|nr:hypothetical protein BS78_01G302200 [Paspalum vaginatum]
MKNDRLKNLLEIQRPIASYSKIGINQSHRGCIDFYNLSKILNTVDVPMGFAVLYLGCMDLLTLRSMYIPLQKTFNKLTLNMINIVPYGDLLIQLCFPFHLFFQLNLSST